MSAELLVFKELLLSWLEVEVALSSRLPRALGQPAGTLAGPWRAGRVLGLGLQRTPDSKCSSELIAFPGI